MIAREMIARYKIAREQTRRELEEKYKKPVFFAHELTSCSLKRQLSRSLTEIDLSSSFNPRMMLGEIVEYGVEMFMNKLGYIKPDKPCILELDDIVVAGSPDYISKDGKTLVDIKYSKQLDMREHHATRMEIYLTICNGEKGILLYISRNGIRNYEISEKIDLKKIELLAKTQAAPRYAWECKLCVFQDFCSHSRVISFGE